MNTTLSAAPEPTAGPATSAAARSGSWFRGDVDGLRAIAIILVVGYHAGLPFLGGGFIGVDVFFVISGFLISRNLLREADGAERVGLADFWSRRIRRLVPALALMVTATLVASWFILPTIERQSLGRQGAAAALYVSNILFAGQSQNYFAADVETSPFLHTWSLGVEEQFYLVWPFVFAAVCWWARRYLPPISGDRRRQGLIAVFAATFVVSLALNVWLTAQGSTWAFFSLPTRAWEFAVAGLLAALPVPRLLRGVGARTGTAVAGLAVLAVGCTVIDDATAYPGLWALIPVVGTVLVILGGETFGGAEPEAAPSRALALRPVQWVGRVSYSWYLWHWPAIVLAVAWRGHDTVTVKTAAALGSLVIAWLAYGYFETPLRFSSLLSRTNARTYVVGAVVTVAVVVLALGVARSAPAAGLDDGRIIEAPAGASLDEQVAVATAAYERRAETDCPKNAVQTPDGDDYCVGGDPNGSRTLLLLGDSHAGQWRATLDAIARDHGIKLLIRQHNGCASFDVQRQDPKPEKLTICERQRAGDLRVFDALQPDAVIVGNSAAFRDRILDEGGELATPDEQVDVWRSGVDGLLGEFEQRGIPVIWILDEPQLPFEADACLTKEHAVEACEVSLEQAMASSGPLLEAERQVLAERGIERVVDMPSIVCDQRTCRLQIDGTLVYVDSHHLTDAFAAKQRPVLEEQVLAVLGR